MKPELKKILKKMGVVLVVLIFMGAGAAWYRSRSDADVPPFQTATVTRGELTVTISATGTVEPEEVIDVGAQVAGQILSFGKDSSGRTIDYGSKVSAGMVLARIDDSLYTSEAANAQAQVQAAEAALQRAQADLEQYKAKLDQAQRDWRRAQKIGPSEALAQASYDAYRSAYETALANVAVGQAAIGQARAGQAQAQAVLKRAQRNLSYCTIVSPVNGVIIDRRVNIGQTVVASLNAPSLFLIAKDLTRMQVWVAVNEADIGKIKVGMPVSFTVDAFPGETFKGSVGKIRLNASMTQNVVTYTVEIATDNSDGRLLPYLTANVKFQLQNMEQALRVPTSALRWVPQPGQIAPEFRQAAKGQGESSGPRPGRNSQGQGQPARGGGENHLQKLWTPEGAFVRPVPVRTLASDGNLSAVEGQGLEEGLPVVTGVQSADSKGSDTRNPFAPQFGRGRR